MPYTKIPYFMSDYTIMCNNVTFLRVIMARAHYSKCYYYSSKVLLLRRMECSSTHNLIAHIAGCYVPSKATCYSIRIVLVLYQR